MPVSLWEQVFGESFPPRKCHIIDIIDINDSIEQTLPKLQTRTRLVLRCVGASQVLYLERFSDEWVAKCPSKLDLDGLL